VAGNPDPGTEKKAVVESRLHRARRSVTGIAGCGQLRVRGCELRGITLLDRLIERLHRLRVTDAIISPVAKVRHFGHTATARSKASCNSCSS